MPLLQPTKDILKFLHENPIVRSKIVAPPNATLLFSGEFFRPIRHEIEILKRSNPQIASKRTLQDVLSGIFIQGQPYPTLYTWAEALEIPWQDNGFIVWKALSGIFASNAIGAVSFSIGSEITDSKVFSATELPVLLRNPNIDLTTRNILLYYQRCIQTGKIDGESIDINFGFIGG